MPAEDTDTGVNTEADAAADDVITNLVDGAGETTQPATENKEPVPYERFKEVNDAKNEAIAAKAAAEAQNVNLQTQFQMMQTQKEPVQQQTAKSFFEEKFGLEADEQPNVEQIEAHTAYVAQMYSMQAQQNQVQENVQRFIDDNADFAEKVGSYTPAGFVASAKMQKVMAAKPRLAKAFYSGNITVEAAYDAVDAFEAKTELAGMRKTAKERKAQQTAALKTGPLSPAAVGGGGSVERGVNAGLDPNTQVGKDAILANFERMREGDYDTDDD